MSFELAKERIVLDKKAGKESTQLLLESDFIVPDIKPDVKLILQTDGKVSLSKTEVTVGKVSFAGGLTLDILYLAKNADKPVHNMNQVIGIDESLNMDGLIKDMSCAVDCEIKHLECRMLNERKITVRAVIDVVATAYTSVENEVVVDVSGMPNAQLMKSALSMNRTMDNKEDRFIVKDELSVPSGKPNIREVLQSSIRISNKEVKVQEAKVVIKGDLTICTLYVGDTDESLVEYIEHEVPFNGGVEMRDANESCFADVSLKVGEQYIQVRPDGDGEERLLDIEVALCVRVKLSNEHEFSMIEDAYCINKKTNMVKEKVGYPKTICRNRSQSAVKESVLLEGDCPPIMQVYHVNGRPSIDDIRVMEDKVVIEGVIASNIIYVAEDDELPIFSYNAMIPFKQNVETKGAREGMNVEVDTDIPHIGFNMLSATEVELRYVVNLNVHVVEEKEIEMIKDIELEALDKDVLDSFASMTVYVVQPNDTLWKIAKKYNSSIEDIVRLNEIENPAKIYPGQKLMILKLMGE